MSRPCPVPKSRHDDLAQEPAATPPASDNVCHRQPFPVINRIHASTPVINDTLAELQPTRGEHDDVLIAAVEVVGR
jgi:hypothetical protein